VGRSRRTRIGLFTAVGLIATAIALGAYAFHVFRTLESNSVDTRFSIRGSLGQPKDVVIVAMDSKTVGDFHNRLRWPFPRRYSAQVIHNIAAQHPKAIAIDIQFTEPTDTRDDNALITAVARAKNVVLSATEVDSHGKTNVFGGYLPPGARAADGVFPVDSDGVMRQMVNFHQGLVTFGPATAAMALGKPLPRGDATHWINFAGPPGTVKTYSYSQVYFNKVPKDAFTGKVVVVGDTDPIDQDIHNTSAGQVMPGPEVEANAIETALHGFPLNSAPRWLNVLLIVLLGMLPVLMIRVGAVWATIAAIAAGALYAVVVQFAFNHGVVLVFVYPLLALAVSAVGIIVVFYVLEAFERAMTRDVFARFVPETVVDQVLLRTHGELRLGGEKVFGTVMFTDLRGFTTFSEGREADLVISLLNRYLSSMSDAVLAHGGTLVTYTGDGMMAVFGAPLPQEDHADRGLAAAREMLEVRLPAFNQWLAEQGYDYKFKMGVGLNSGEFMSGNVGSERRLEYTAIGDTINTASRIEGMTKGTPYALYLAGSTKDSFVNPPDDLIYIDEMAVRGRAHTIPIWSLTSELIKKENWESEGKSPPPAAEAAEPEPASAV
jgi:adenylate cyclase